LSDPDGVLFFPGVAEALRAWGEAGYLRVVVTNQSGVARGWHTMEAVHAIHRRMEEELALAGAGLERFFVCPDHPDQIPPSRDRKPQSGMYIAAIRQFAIDPDASWAVGDMARDLIPAHGLGVSCALVLTGRGRDVPDGRLPKGTTVHADFAAFTRATLGLA
ncbi:HAD-IIIA family hydrolase, partial [bacterium]|nr:HAD-IIIA family hydrolase [bacterium]